jgi:hypothetical protein
MNGLIRSVAAAVGGLAVVAVGCDCYSDLVDRCYPERYEHMARKEVYGAFTPQVQNGHVLDQTVWEYDFEPGTDKLNGAGFEKLAYIARRRPCPDPMVYLQTAQGIVYDPANPDKMAEARQNLDNRRIQAVHNFLTAQTAGRHLDFQVVVHDPGEVDLGAIPVGNSVQQMYLRFRGGLLGGAGASVTGGAGAVGGGGGAVGAAGGAR